MNDCDVVLRALEPGDVDSLYLWENDISLWPYGDRRAPLSRFQLTEYVENYEADPLRAGQLRLMIEADGMTVGAIDLYDVEPRCRRAGVGIIVNRSNQGKGIGGAALKAVTVYCRQQLELNQLWCVMASDNKASRRLFEAAGFELSGTLRQWFQINRQPVDALIYQLIL